MRIHRTICLCSLFASLLIASVHAQVEFEASWRPQTYDQVRTQMLNWLDTAEFDKDLAFEARSLWPAGNLRASDGAALLDRVAETFALVDPQAKALVDACNTPYAGPVPPSADWLEGADLSPILRSNMRLYFARWMAQRMLYDDVISVLGDLTPKDVVDPAGLLFYRMVAHHQIVDLDNSHLFLEKLMEQEEQLPVRYLQVAQLLRRDLAALKEESLDHVARRMNDVRRRLDIGRAGRQVQVVEKDVVDSLDRIIKKLEQQQQQGGGAAGGGQQSLKPMQDSQLPSMRAPMQVEQRRIGEQSGWGDLPAKDREKALQQIGREFPSHYREVIEQYFRELADETSGEATR